MSFLQAEHEEKEKLSRNPDWKSKDKRCSKAPEKCAMPYHHHLGQILTSTIFKKVKQASLRRFIDVKKKDGKYAAPALSTLHAAGSKDSKSFVFSHTKEYLKQKAKQQKEHDSKPNKLFNKSVMAPSATAEQQLLHTMKAFKEN